MHKNSSRLFAVLFFILVTNSVSAQTGILWQVSGNGTPAPSYLFGTIHDDDPRVMALHPLIKKAFNNAGSFSAEVKLDAVSLMQMSTMMFQTTQQPLKPELTAAEYKKCVSILASYGIPEMMINHMAPWAIATTISLPNKQTTMVLDLKLYMDAQAKGKQVYGLETIAEQLGVFNKLSRADQIAMLKQTLAEHHKVAAMYKELLDAYLERDLSELQALDKKYNQGTSEKLRDFFKDELLNNRNHLMVKRMQPRLKEGNAFIAVGALHLPGQQGIIQLLRDKGYQLRAIY